MVSTLQYVRDPGTQATMAAFERPMTGRRLLTLAIGTAPLPVVFASCSSGSGEPRQAGSAPGESPDAGSPATPSPVAEAATPVAQSPTASPTAACLDLKPTLAQTEGPYYTPNTPRRASLIEPGMAGTRLKVTGLVLSTKCQPVGNAMLDFWQADASGAYDNAGYRLRGHQFSDAQGRYALETVVPGEYPGRTPHIHVKVQAPERPVLTTQVYFPDAARNQSDGIFRPELVMDVRDEAGGKVATFNFVLDLG